MDRYGVCVRLHCCREVMFGVWRVPTRSRRHIHRGERGKMLMRLVFLDGSSSKSEETKRRDCSRLHGTCIQRPKRPASGNISGLQDCGAPMIHGTHACMHPLAPGLLLVFLSADDDEVNLLIQEPLYQRPRIISSVMLLPTRTLSRGCKGLLPCTADYCMGRSPSERL